MFGLLRADARDTRYRQIYAGYCGFQHRQFGLESLPLLSYEAMFLYLLAVDAGVCNSPDQSAVTCCRLRRSGVRLYQVDEKLATFCCSFGLILASVKLEDDVRDDGSLLARLAAWRLRSPVQRAKNYLASLDPAFPDRIRNYIDQHLRLERSGSRPTLDEYAEPTANSFASVFVLFARLLPSEAIDEPLLHEIGAAVGRAIICFDCAVDWQSDRRRGRFNPLQHRDAAGRALLASQQWLSQVAWQCGDAFGPAAHSAAVAAATFGRMQKYVGRTGSVRDVPRRRAARRFQRRGDCDCPCDPNCCDGCHCPDCCTNSGDNAWACFCPGCDCCCDCDFGSRRTKKTNGNTRQPITRRGSVGRTLGPLKPAGVVLIDGERVPARSESGWIDADVQVEVARDEAFGVVVRPRKAGPP